jgi:hypothetical protein
MKIARIQSTAGPRHLLKQPGHRRSDLLISPGRLGHFRYGAPPSPRLGLPCPARTHPAELRSAWARLATPGLAIEVHRRRWRRSHGLKRTGEPSDLHRRAHPSPSLGVPCPAEPCPAVARLARPRRATPGLAIEAPIEDVHIPKLELPYTPVCNDRHLRVRSFPKGFPGGRRQ